MSYNKILGTQCYEIKEGWSLGGGGGELFFFLAKNGNWLLKNQHKRQRPEEKEEQTLGRLLQDHFGFFCHRFFLL